MNDKEQIGSIIKELQVTSEINLLAEEVEAAHQCFIRLDSKITQVLLAEEDGSKESEELTELVPMASTIRAIRLSVENLKNKIENRNSRIEL